MSNILTKYRSFWICLVLTLAATAVFYRVYTFDFINFDDPVYVSQNPNIQAGITLKAVKWAFTASRAANWHPITWLSHMLDWQFFGSNAAGHHLTNLIFHIANTLLLFIILKQMTKAIWPSAFVAALFALHPLHVESVAWVSERKDVLSTFFWLLTMWAYIRFVDRPKITNYLLIVVFFALGLMSKPMLVTLPFVLLLLDYWPLQRFNTKRPLSLLIEKIPLFVMVLASSIVTFIVQRKGQAIRTVEDYTIPVRLANASISYMQYIIKMIWPVRLAVFYPHPGQNVSVPIAVISAIFLLIVTVLVFRFAGNHKYLVTGWLWYIGTLVPVIGLIQVGNQAVADRYSYITLTGLFIIIAWGLPELLGKWTSASSVESPQRKIVLWISSLMVLSALAVCANLQLRYWKNSITIFQHALNVTKNNYMAHFCMTPMLLEQGRIEEAIWHNSEALRIKPDYLSGLNSLAVSLHKAGRIDEAIYYYNKALGINPAAGEVHVNLAAALAAESRFDEAVRHYRIALDGMDTPFIRSDLASSLMSLGRFEEAVIEYRKALSAVPDDPNILNGLGCALAQTGNFDEAVSLYSKALQIAPDLVNIRLNLGFALSSSGRLAQAVQEYEKILLIQPQNAVAHNDIGVALSRQGKLDEAIAHFNRAIQIDSDYAAARDNLNIALNEKQKTQSKSEENMKKK